jgi:HAD superfamily hydrolase (TIGR01509 family)
MAGLTVIDGADRALIEAKARGAVAVASSSRAHFLDSKLKRMGLFDLAAPHIYSADLVEHGKPAPDIFLYTAEKLGVPPRQCLVLEDSVNGVRAGLAAGMQVWGFVGGGHCYDGYGDRLMEAGAQQIMRDYAAVLDALRVAPASSPP